MVVEELIALLGFKTEGQADIQRFNKQLEGTREKMKSLVDGAAKMAVAFTAAFSAAAFGVTRFVEGTANRLDAIGKAAERAGVTVESLQKLGYAAEQSGSTTSEMSDTLENLNRRLAEAARGTGRARTALRAYGLSAVDSTGKAKDASEFLLELADAAERMSEAEVADLAQSLGLSRGVVTLLRSGRGEIERLGREAEDSGFIIEREGTERSAVFGDTLNRLRNSVRGVADAIAVDLMPPMTDVMRRLQDWLNANREFIRQNVSAVMLSIGGNIRFLAEQLDRLNVSPFWVLAAAALILARRFGRFAIALVLIQDVLTWFSDNDAETTFGKLVERIQELSGLSEGAAATIAGIGAAVLGIGLLKPSLIFAPLLAGIKALAPHIVAAMGVAFAGLATPAGWAVILAAVIAALVVYFRQELAAMGASLASAAYELGAAIGSAIVNGITGALAGARDAIRGSLGIPEEGFRLPFVSDSLDRLEQRGRETLGGSFGMSATTQAGAASIGRTIGAAGAAVQNNVFNIDQVFNQSPGQTTAEMARAGTRDGALDAMRQSRSLSILAPSPAQ